MFNSGKKIRAMRDKINKYSNSRVVRKKIFMIFMNTTLFIVPRDEVMQYGFVML